MSFLSARTKAELSQVAVAKEIGISDAAVSMWETGKTRPRAALLVRLAGMYNCTVDDLLDSNPVRTLPEQDQSTTSKES